MYTTTTANQSKIQIYTRFLRFDKPSGIGLLLWPTLTALFVASNGTPSLKHILIFSLGCIIMRATGCAINDVWDQDFDKHVQRTATRPLTQNLITKKEAWLIFFFGLSLSFLLVLNLNTFCIALSFIGVILATIYPLMKRFIPIPQAMLSLTFSWGIPMTFAATRTALPLECWLLFISNGILILIYDSYYAKEDAKYDQKIGLNSSALLFGSSFTNIMRALQLLYLASLVLIQEKLQLHPTFWLGIAMVSLIFIYQNKLDYEHKWLQAFKVSQLICLVVFLSVVMSLH